MHKKKICWRRLPIQLFLLLLNVIVLYPIFWILINCKIPLISRRSCILKTI